MHYGGLGADIADRTPGRAAGRKLSQFPIQAANVASGLNVLGQLNQAAAQQTAQAVLGSATNGAVVTQGNLAGVPPLTCRVPVLLVPLMAACAAHQIPLCGLRINSLYHIPVIASAALCCFASLAFKTAPCTMEGWVLT